MAFWSNKDASPARKYRFKAGPSGTNWWYISTVTLPSFTTNVGEYQLLNQTFKYPGVPKWEPVTISIIDTADSVEQIKKALGAQGFDFLQEEGLTKLMTNDTRKALRKGIQADLDKSIKKSNDSIQKKTMEGYDIANTSTPFSQVLAKRDKSQAQAQAELKNAAIMRAKGVIPSDANDIIIEQMSGDGSTFRTWTLKNSFISSVNYGDLSYSSDELVSMEIVVTYDYATTEK
jgi:hypothetical protein